MIPVHIKTRLEVCCGIRIKEHIPHSNLKLFSDERPAAATQPPPARLGTVGRRRSRSCSAAAAPLPPPPPRHCPRGPGSRAGAQLWVSGAAWAAVRPRAPLLQPRRRCRPAPARTVRDDGALACAWPRDRHGLLRRPWEGGRDSEGSRMEGRGGEEEREEGRPGQGGHNPLGRDNPLGREGGREGGRERGRESATSSAARATSVGGKGRAGSHRQCNRAAPSGGAGELAGLRAPCFRRPAPRSLRPRQADCGGIEGGREGGGKAYFLFSRLADCCARLVQMRFCQVFKPCFRKNLKFAPSRCKISNCNNGIRFIKVEWI
jgi:hypothetical protein